MSREIILYVFLAAGFTFIGRYVYVLANQAKKEENKFFDFFKNKIEDNKPK